MTFTDIMYSLGHFFQWTFKIMQTLQNGPNLFFWLLIGGLLITWLRMQAKFNKEAKEKNTLQ